MKRYGKLGADTGYPLPHRSRFPPSRVDREMMLEFQRKLAKETLLIPSIVAAEFIEVRWPQARSRSR